MDRLVSSLASVIAGRAISEIRLLQEVTAIKNTESKQDVFLRKSYWQLSDWTGYISLMP
jgi:hypothetical protein